MQREKTPEWWGKTERLTWHKARTGVSLSFSISYTSSSNENVLVFPSIENALKELSKVTDHVYVSGGGQIYNSLIEKADIIHLSTVHVEVEGDIKFPIMPENFNLVFEQFFMSNINYTYQIWKKG